MKFIKGFFKWVFILIILGNILLIITGNIHFYKAVRLTVFKGSLQPSIDDYPHFINREIKTGTPQPWAISSRYNQTKIKADDLAYMESLGTVAYLVIRNDSIIHESYWDGKSDSSLTNSFSMAKSVVSVLVGCALQDGLIKDINDPVVKYLPEYQKVTGDKVTIRHLLTMSSGINFHEQYGNPFGMMAKAYYGNSLQKVVMGYEPESEPGKEFNYLGGNTLLLGFMVQKLTGKTLSDYASEKLWKPMGAVNPALWTTDSEHGFERSYCCFYSNARDFARLGKLYMDSGRWDDKQIVPEGYVLNSIVPAKDILDGGGPNDIYGYQWWCLTYKGQPLFYARGILGQYIIVNPNTKTIVVRLGHKRDSNRKQGHPMEVWRSLDIAGYITQEYFTKN